MGGVPRGRADTDRPTVRARLTDGLISPAGKRQYRRARYSAEVGTVTLVGGAGSHLLAALASSNCLVKVPDEVESLEAGAEVTVLLLRS